jgi:hypothetical protein
MWRWEPFWGWWARMMAPLSPEELVKVQAIEQRLMQRRVNRKLSAAGVRVVLGVGPRRWRE